jgi:hypothetical protein
MSTAEGSVVKEILNCIRAVCEKQRQLERFQAEVVTRVRNAETHCHLPVKECRA